MAYTPAGETRDRVFQFVRQRLLEGHPPTIREVQDAMGFAAVESARRQLNALVEEGRLEKAPGRSRGYRLPGQRSRGPRAVHVPVVGRIPAGGLQEAIEIPMGQILLETRHRPDELFALRVIGDSMIDAGIFEDDVVVVRRQPRADTGAIVVAMVDGEATVKTLRFRRTRVVLHPANSKYEPLEFREADLEILGIVVEVRREMLG